MGESEEVGDGEEQNKRGGKRAGGESKRCKRGALWSGLVWFGLVFPADGFGAGPCSSLAKENQDGGSSRPQASMPGLAASGMSP